MTVPAKTRKLVYQRDNYVCVHCGTTNGLTLQHRASRGMGGSKSLDGPENLVTMCWQANTDLESNPDFMALGRKHGWKLSRWEDPTTIPVRYFADGVFYLTDRFTRIKTERTD